MSVLEQIAAAKTPADIFGPLTDAEEVKRIFRQMAKAAHPDRNPDEKTAAEEAFARLGELYRTALRWIERGSTPTRIKTRKLEYEIDPVPAFAGDVADFHHGTFFADRQEQDVLVKVARASGATSLMQNEARMLKRIDKEIDRQHALYFPGLVESFRVKGTVTRQANVFIKGPQLFSLDQVQARYPQGIDPKDAAWMFRRILFALGLAHRAGVVHGAVLKRHILIQPENHGLTLVDWKHAVEPGGKIPVIPAGSRYSYAPEILDKQPASPATDIWMAVNVMHDVLVDRTPKPFSAFFRGSTQDSPRARPQDAWELLGEFDNLIERMWGKRKYHPFSMQ